MTPEIVLSGSRSLKVCPDVVWREFLGAMTALHNRGENLPGPPYRYVHGNAPGVDRILGARLQARGRDVLPVPAEWDRYGKRAGHLRNEAMLERPNALALVAIWDGSSPGTKSAIDLAVFRYGLTVALEVRTINLQWL